MFLPLFQLPAVPIPIFVIIIPNSSSSSILEIPLIAIAIIEEKNTSSLNYVILKVSKVKIVISSLQNAFTISHTVN